MRAVDAAKVREGNALALRAYSMAINLHERKKPWIVEQPHRRPGSTSMWNLDEFESLLAKDDVFLYTFAQCQFGCSAEKLTDFMSNIPAMNQFAVHCNHTEKWWRIPWSGEWLWAAHPPLKGKQWAICADKWHPLLLRNHEPPGDFITRSVAAYPGLLNKALAEALVSATQVLKPVQLVRHVTVNDKEATIRYKLPMRGTQDQTAPQDDRNSLRNVYRWVTDRHRYIGVQCRNIIEELLDSNPNIQEQVLESFGRKSAPSIENEQWVDDLRARIAELLVRNRRDDQPKHCDTSEVDPGIYSTVIRGRFLHYWAHVVGDPAELCARWTYEGAPAGLQVPTNALDGVFPCVDADEEHTSLDNLATDYGNFQNYTGVEDSSEAFDALEGYARKGYLAKFQTLEEVTSFLGEDPVLSKLGCIVKERTNPDTGQVVKKVRIILDCKRSCVSSMARRTHKAVLPRLTDAVYSALELMKGCVDSEQSLLVADIVDAFWLIPLRAEERRFFVARLRGHYYVFLRTAQGSRAAPLTFAAIAAIGARWVQSLSDEFRMQMYVDDPLTVLRGSWDRRRRLAATIVIAWSVMGFPIASHKAVLANTLVWIGMTLSIRPSSVHVEVPGPKVSELLALVEEASSCNVVSKKALRTLLGKSMAIASIVFTWRPFLPDPPVVENTKP